MSEKHTINKNACGPYFDTHKSLKMKQQKYQNTPTHNSGKKPRNDEDQLQMQASDPSIKAQMTLTTTAFRVGKEGREMWI